MQSSDRNQKLCFSFAAWFVERANSHFSVSCVRKATVQLWAEVNNIDLSLEEIDYIFTNWQACIEVKSNLEVM